MSDSVPPAPPLSALIAALRRLPGMTQHLATQLATQLAGGSPTRALSLAAAIVAATASPLLCSRCYNLSLSDPCALCRDATRERHRLRVVEEPLDAFVWENLGGYRGLYHVLHGVLSPLDGVGPDNLRIAELVRRIEHDSPPIEEIVIAMRDDTPGKATAMYLWKTLQPYRRVLSHDSTGLPKLR